MICYLTRLLYPLRKTKNIFSPFVDTFGEKKTVEEVKKNILAVLFCI